MYCLSPKRITCHENKIYENDDGKNASKWKGKNCVVQLNEINSSTK